MSRDNKERIKHKDDRQIDPLFQRWQSDPYRIILKRIKEEKKVQKSIPKFEGKYDLRQINLRKTRLVDVSLANACLELANAYNLYLTKCDLSKCTIHSGDFEESRIIDCNLIDSEFTNCNFLNSFLSNILMQDASFYECDFNGAELNNINIDNTIFEKSNFCNLINPTRIKFIGKPKTLRGSIIDRYTLLLLPDSDFKKMILKEGKVQDDKFNREYDVALSFAGENRAYVEKVANYLKDRSIRVFYDDFERHELWGKELVTYLTELYGEKCSYVIIFVSEYYNNKSWTNVERIASLSRILSGDYDTILPVKMDDTITKGLTNSKGHLDSKMFTPDEIGDIFIKKLTSDISR
jgi:hypothetical protein